MLQPISRTGSWHGRSGDFASNPEILEEYRQARAHGDYDTAVIYAGQAVAMMRDERSAAEIVLEIGGGAEELLRRRVVRVLDG